MSTKQQLEMAMIRAQVAANRSMREAAANPNDQSLWDLWQQAEERVVHARKAWQAAVQMEMKHAA